MNIIMSHLSAYRVFAKTVLKVNAEMLEQIAKSLSS